MADERGQSVAPDWFAQAFGPWYPLVYAHRSVDSAVPEVAFACQQLALSPGARVLDLCCGNGRHMVHLAAAGLDVTGLDYSPVLLVLARENAGASAKLLRADMRAIPFLETFDGVFNFFTSFGYFMDPVENLQVARGVARALRPGGRFFIDYCHAGYIRTHLVPHSVREDDGYTIDEKRWIDEEMQRVNKELTVSCNGEIAHRSHESVRLYEPRDFEALLHEAGLCVERFYGDYGGAELDAGRPRMIAVGHRSS